MSKNNPSVNLKGRQVPDQALYGEGIRINPNENLQDIIVALKLRVSRKDIESKLQTLSKLPPKKRQYLTHEEYTRDYAPANESLQQIKKFADQHNLTAGKPSPGTMFIRLSGKAGDFEKAFCTELQTLEKDGMRYRLYKGQLQIPEEYCPVIQAVLGLYQATPIFGAFREEVEPPMTVASEPNWNLPPYIAGNFYNFPSGYSGATQTIAFLESESANYESKDFDTYFSQYIHQTAPTVTDLSPNGTGNTGEIMEDLEIAGSIAYESAFVIYRFSDLLNGLLETLCTAIFDEDHNPDVISLSYGLNENAVTEALTFQFDLLCGIACLLGKTICASSGDYGAAGRINLTSLTANVNYPASSPFILACGGTELVVSTSKGTPVLNDEIVWNNGQYTAKGATGGGISTYYTVPKFQVSLPLPSSVNKGAGPGRGLPDVASNASPDSGYGVYKNGSYSKSGSGTSAAAPLWAALIAIINQALGANVGWIHPNLYEFQQNPKSPSQAPCKLIAGMLSDGSIQNNGGNTSDPEAMYYAKTGDIWNACCGLGSPNGQNLLNAYLDMENRE